MARVIDELAAVIGIEVDKQKLQTANKSFSNVITSFIGIKTAVLAATIALFEFERRMAKGIASIGNSSTILDTNAQDLQVLKLAADEAGVSYDAVTGAISRLNSQASNFETTRKVDPDLIKNIALLSQASGKSISLFDNGKMKKFSVLFKEIAPLLAKVEKTDIAQARGFSQNIFGSNLLPVIDKLKEARKESKDGNLILSDKEIQGMQKANIQFILLGRNLEVLAQRGAIALEPLFESINKGVSEVFPLIQKLAAGFSGWLDDPSLSNGLKLLIASLSAIKGLMTGIGSAISFAEQGTIGVGKAIGNTAGFIAEKISAAKSFNQRSLLLHSKAAAANISNNNSSNNQSSSISTNTTNNNNNRTVNTTVHNNILPSNLQSILTVGTIR